MDLERTSPGISTVHGEDGSESKLVRWRIRSESLFGLECERGRNVKASQLWRKKRQPCASFLIFFSHFNYYFSYYICLWLSVHFYMLRYSYYTLNLDGDLFANHD